MASTERAAVHPGIVAHRGVSALFPENTAVAFEAAVLSRADAIEFDVQLSADGRAVVCHDTTLTRYGYPSISLDTWALDELRTLDTGSWFSPAHHDQTIQTLDEVLDRYGSRIELMIELKTRDMSSDQVEVLVDELFRCLAATGPQPSILCFDLSVLRSIHERAPDLPVVWNTKHGAAAEVVCRDEHAWLSGIDCRIDSLTTDVTKLAHSVDMSVFTFTCNSRSEIIKARELGVQAIITDDPESCAAILNAPMSQAG